MRDPSWLDVRKAEQAAARAELAALNGEPTVAEKAAAVAGCGLCDSDGYDGLRVCDHQDHRAAAVRGMQLVREALSKEGKS